MQPTNLVLSLVAMSFVVALAGCGGSSGAPAATPPTVPPAAVGSLKRVADPQELEASLKTGLLKINPAPDAALAVLPGAADFTGTYTQEANIDEADTVRYDGNHLYVAPTRFYSCCFLASAGPATNGDPLPGAQDRSIRILATNAATASATPVGSIALADGVSVQGMYVQDDRLFALTASAYFGHFGDFWSSTSIWAPERIGYRIYDVSDRAAPALQSEVQIDGVLVDSRRIGNEVYIVSRYAPFIDGLLYSVTTAAERAHNEALLDGVSLDDLLPKVAINGIESTLIDPVNCYLTTDNDDGFPILTSVTRVPIDNPAAMTTTCYNEESHGVYLTRQSLYFTSVNYSPTGSEQTTSVHKFGLTSGTPEYRGSVDVAGHVWRGGQADFRMSEHNGDLRVLTVQYIAGADDTVDHALYVLRESATAPELVVVGQLPNAQRPTEIGKPNEALYGVRFLGDRAYAVTFEQIDPLYAIDLSDPSDPKIAGELTVTGFSDFLHPVSDELLLGLGTGEDGGVKVELFDVSVITQPLSRGGVTFGPGSASEATYNRYAFTYLPGTIDRMAIPVTRYLPDGQYGAYLTGLQLLEIRDKTLPNLATLTSVGELSPPVASDFGWVNRNRSYLNGDAVFYVRGEEIWSALWGAPEQLGGPY